VGVSWQRAVVFTHRWLGIVLGVFFTAWFGSGVVMMYARMPRLAPSDRHAALEPLDLSTAQLSPGDVIRRHALTDIDEIRIEMWMGRPVYRLATGGGQLTFSAISGDSIGPLSAADALECARRFAPGARATARYDTRLESPDQWTLELRGLLPAHRVALGDAADSHLYISVSSGETILRTTARERRIAYVGAILHWLYFTPFRRNGALWAQTIIWMSMAGTLLCVLGLIWGLYTGFSSPYRGWMRWHHYAGLLFGAVTLTWMFSGLLSMDPWNWHPATTPTNEQRKALRGNPEGIDQVDLARLRATIGPRRSGIAPKEIEIVPFRGRARLIVDGRALEPLDRVDLARAVSDSVPGGSPLDDVWLEDYDAYYYDRTRELPLPVVRVRFDDPRSTWLYLDAVRGMIVRKEERLTRVNRWLYHGLHSFDFPALYNRRPLWDILVIVLSLGGLASIVTAAVPAWRRLRPRSRYDGNW